LIEQIGGIVYNSLNMARYFIGTAGWSYKDWEGIVYPEKKESHFHALTYLAQFTNVVEINSTFYRIPAMHIALSWTKRISHNPEFLFSVKLHQIFTHQRKDFSQKDVDDFKFGIEPLRAKDKLAAILIQFPWSFANTTSHLDYLAKLFKQFSGYSLAIEVRHSTWNHEIFYKLLEDFRVCFCNIDQPQIGKSIKPSAIATTPELSYVRLHGRNYENWFKKDAGRDDRYDYLYKANELDDWVKRIKELGNKSEKVLVITNNHYRGQALANALQIKNKITGEKLNIPLSLLKTYPLLKDIAEKIKSGQYNLFPEE